MAQVSICQSLDSKLKPLTGQFILFRCCSNQPSGNKFLNFDYDWGMIGRPNLYEFWATFGNFLKWRFWSIGNFLEIKRVKILVNWQCIEESRSRGHLFKVCHKWQTQEVYLRQVGDPILFDSSKLSQSWSISNKMATWRKLGLDQVWSRQLHVCLSTLVQYEYIEKCRQRPTHLLK